MIKKIKVSVLVPVYNVEKYLAACLDSLVNQTLKEIEIICINDGSVDDSLNIISDYARNDGRIVVINKKNSGYGDSMNIGLKKAKGEYIAIVESDDFIELDACEKLYKLAKRYDADIVRANYYYHTDSGDEIHESIKEQTLEYPQSIMDDSRILYEAPAIWSAIYRREFLKESHIEFLPTPGASYQDTGFNLKALCMAKRIVYSKEAYLHYRTDNDNSSVKSSKKADYVLKEYVEAEKYLDEMKVPIEIRYMIQAVKFNAFYWNLLRLSNSLMMPFLKKMRANLKSANKRGLLKKQYFSLGHWTALWVVINMPPFTYYAAIVLRKSLIKK